MPHHPESYPYTLLFHIKQVFRDLQREDVERAHALAHSYYATDLNRLLKLSSHKCMVDFEVIFYSDEKSLLRCNICFFQWTEYSK
jgi:hypothetical protein